MARQQLKPTYHRNGIAYAITRKCLTEQQTTIGENCGAVVIDLEAEYVCNRKAPHQPQALQNICFCIVSKGSSWP